MQASTGVDYVWDGSRMRREFGLDQEPVRERLADLTTARGWIWRSKNRV